MFRISVEISTNEEIWELFDKSLDHIFIHKFNPNEAIEWWRTSVKMKNGHLLDNVLARQLQFDLQTDLKGLRQIMDLVTYQLSIYQFDKPVPHTLIMDYLPEQKREAILKQNGLKHSFFIDFEFLTVESFDVDFIRSIEANPLFMQRVIKRQDR